MILQSQACLSWLCYLQQTCGKELIGPLNDKLLRVCGVYDISPQFLEYYAELPLIGEPGIDLSAQYCAVNFLEGNPLTDPQVLDYGDFIYKYVVALNKHLPQIVPKCFCFLEKDTATGDSEKTAVFLNISGNMVARLLPQIMAWQNKSDRLLAVQKYLRLVAPKFVLWHIGFMHSREEDPVRLVMVAPDGKANDVLEALKRLDKEREAVCMEAVLREIEATELFDYILDIDVMPDGSLGDVVGLELLTRKIRPAAQLSMFRDVQYTKFLALLQNQGIADQRIELLPKCSFAMQAPDEHQERYFLASRISHFKLRWKDCQPLPAKVYLQMTTMPAQYTLNEVFL